MDDEIGFIPVALIREPCTLLRLVNKDSVEYLELRDSIRDNKILNSVLVRPAVKFPGEYEIVDGLYRYTIAKELRMECLPCIIKHTITDDQVLSLQIQANAIRPETTPVEFAQQMKKLLTLQPDMTIPQLACLIRKSPQWVGDRLGLIKLLKDAQVMVDRGEIPVQSAYMLAKIPRSKQRDYLDSARTMAVPQFKALAASVVKHYLEAIKQGKMDAFYSDTFKAQPHLRSLKEIEKELSSREVGALVVVGEGCRTSLDYFYAGLRWVCHLDKQSVLEQEHAARGRRERQALDVTLDDEP